MYFQKGVSGNTIGISGFNIMINTKKTLREYLNYEKKFYFTGNFIQSIRLYLVQSPNYLIWRYQKFLRISEYHFNTKHKLRYVYFKRLKNIQGARLGIYINHNCIEKGLRIYHYGSIIIHENAHIGENLSLHGDNCIGNKGISMPEKAPLIGDNCDVGIGAKILGDINLGHNITVGANAVVTKSFLEDNITLIGIPAQISKHSRNKT